MIEVGDFAASLIERFDLSASLIVPIRWEGVHGLIFGTLDVDEHRRREQSGMREVRDRHLLDRLAWLRQAPERWHELAESERMNMRTHLWLADTTDESVHVVASPPTSVDAVVVAGADGAPTVRRASYFAPFGRRIALLTRRPTNEDDVVARALWLEVGVAVTAEEGRVDTFVEPGPRHGDDFAYRWWFAEKIYGSHLRLAAATRRHPSIAWSPLAGRGSSLRGSPRP